MNSKKIVYYCFACVGAWTWFGSRGITRFGHRACARLLATGRICSRSSSSSDMIVRIVFCQAYNYGLILSLFDFRFCFCLISNFKKDYMLFQSKSIFSPILRASQRLWKSEFSCEMTQRLQSCNSLLYDKGEPCNKNSYFNCCTRNYIVQWSCVSIFLSLVLI